MKNQPPSDSDVQDATEAEIHAEIERRARKATEDYRSQLDLYDGRIRRTLLLAEQGPAIDAAGQRAIDDLKVLATNYLNQLSILRDEVAGRDREFSRFREDHGLQRLPKSVSRRELAVRWLVLSIIVMIESVLNGLFFAEGSELGIIGGVSQALVLSFLNVGLAVLAGSHVLPRVFHVRLPVKVIGALGLICYVVIALGLNLSIGHFRDIFVRTEGHVVSRELMEALRSNPFGFSDARSMLLVILGVALSFVSFLDAAGMNDLYPGYGAQGRRRREAITSYADQKARCLAGLTERRDSAIEDMTSVMHEAQTLQFEARQALDGRVRLHKEYCAFLTHLYDCYWRLLRTYQEANAGARSTPSPDRFANQPARPPTLDCPDLPDLNAQAPGDYGIERMKFFIAAIGREFMKASGQFETVPDLTDSGDQSHDDA